VVSVFLSRIQDPDKEVEGGGGQVEGSEVEHAEKEPRTGRDVEAGDSADQTRLLWAALFGSNRSL